MFGISYCSASGSAESVQAGEETVFGCFQEFHGFSRHAFGCFNWNPVAIARDTTLGCSPRAFTTASEAQRQGNFAKLAKSGIGGVA